MSTKKLHAQRLHSVFEKNISKQVKIATKDHKVYEGYIGKIDNGHVYLAIPKTERIAGIVNTKGFGRRSFRRRDFEFIAIPLVLIATLFLL